MTLETNNIDMQGEIDRAKEALQQIIAEIEPSAFPLIALVTCKDKVTIKLLGNDINSLSTKSDHLETQISSVKQNSHILFVTEVPLYHNVEVKK